MQHNFLPVFHRFFPVLPDFHRIFRQKSKKIVKFFAIFSRCVSTSYKKFEKIISQKS